MLRYLLVSFFILNIYSIHAQTIKREPIIDVHLHSMSVGFGLGIEKMIDEHPGMYYKPAELLIV